MLECVVNRCGTINSLCGKSALVVALPFQPPLLGDGRHTSAHSPIAPRRLRSAVAEPVRVSGAGCAERVLALGARILVAVPW